MFHIGYQNDMFVLFLLAKMNLTLTNGRHTPSHILLDKGSIMAI